MSRLDSFSHGQDVRRRPLRHGDRASHERGALAARTARLKADDRWLVYLFLLGRRSTRWGSTTGEADDVAACLKEDRRRAAARRHLLEPPDGACCACAGVDGELTNIPNSWGYQCHCRPVRLATSCEDGTRHRVPQCRHRMLESRIRQPAPYPSKEQLPESSVARRMRA